MKSKMTCLATAILLGAVLSLQATTCFRTAAKTCRLQVPNYSCVKWWGTTTCWDSAGFVTECVTTGTSQGYNGCLQWNGHCAYTHYWIGLWGGTENEAMNPVAVWSSKNTTACPGGSGSF